MVAQALQDPAAISTQDSPPSPFHPSTPSPVPSTTQSSAPSPQSCVSPSLPPLTPHESELLSSFLILRYDLIALAEQNKLHPQQLLAFAMSPAVQAHLAELKKFADQAFALRSLESRTKAIDILEEVAKASDNHIERRRAASAILRGLNPIGGVRHSAVSRGVPAPVSADSGLRTKDSGPLPSARPFPNFSHLETAELIGAALKSPTPDNLATLHAFTSPDATLGESKAPADLDTFIEVARAIVPKQRQHAVVIHTRKATDSFADILCTLTDAPCNATTVQYDLTLTRNSANLWLLSSFKRKPEPRGVG